MKINFLRPLKGRATKTFTYDKEKKWRLAQGYQAGKLFDGYSFTVNNLEEAFKILEKYQYHPAFMIQGDFIDRKNLKGIVRRKRADRSDRHAPTLCDRELQLVCFDVDGYQCDLKNQEAIELFISELPTPFWEADYIYQFSASHGLFSDELKCHLFFWLEKSATNVDLRAWIIAYNSEKDWGNILDPAVFVATQPVYTQRRICLGAPDPVKDFLGLVKKTGELEWSPPPATQESIRTSPSSPPAEKYSLSEGIRRIMTGSSFHDEINKLALSLMAKGIPAREIKETIKGMMLAAKENLEDPKRLQDWEVRFKDIDRSVDSAFQLVDNPSQEDLLAWLKVAPEKQVLKEFPGKTLKKSPAQLKEIIHTISQRTGVDKRTLKRRLKAFREESEEKSRQEKRHDKFKERKKRKVYEVVINKHNYLAAAGEIAKIFKKSPRWPPVFFYGGGLAYIDFDKLITIRQMVKKFKMENAGQKYCRTATIRVFKKPYHNLIARLGLDIRFMQRKHGKEIFCPEKLASVLALGNDPGHRELTGIVQCPFVKENWEIFEKQGYDPETGLFSMIEKKILRPLQYPDDAYKFLREEVLAEFPFKAELDAAVMIAMMMGLMQRPLLSQDSAGMPGFGITAPVQSSGKSTLVDVATTAILKNTVAVSNFSDDDEELAKHVLSLLKEGHTCVFFDNITQGTDIESDVLAKAMSGEVYGGRLLGENKTLNVASSVIWFFAGNNITFSGDFSTRVYPVNLAPKMENPDSRLFIREHILDWTLEHRERILLALASIIVCGKDLKPLPTGSRFKIWDRYIRSTLLEASGIDINQAILSNKEHDLDFINKKRLITNLYESFNDVEFTSRQVIDKWYTSGEMSPPLPCGEVLVDILGKYSTAPKSVGKLLSKMVGRIYNNLVLSRHDTDMAYWKIDSNKPESD